MKRLFGMLLMLPLASYAASYIDQAALKDDSARRALIQQGIKDCPRSKYPTVGDREACLRPYQDKAQQQYPRRGTEAYAQKHYSDMNKAQAEQKLIELQKIAQQAGAIMSTKPGEISRKDAEVEGWWIQRNVLKATPTATSPWFIECKKQNWSATVDQCRLGSGGEN
ncbi:hypothetical protein [Pseudomonas oryzihabitans]|uniref:hypothetical protein n=1 Tax=Pseudomonas oryzihabitans TaxID=47885 RepID=UPI0028940D56|nr:hypothetical protein [Pseudomonas oryzihabitans]MDT3723016.1 hypothetical protein [Pseudomonas oryzihabitans]